MSRRVGLSVVRRFRRGWLCAEAVAGAVLKGAGREVTPQSMRMASAFSGGCGGCGKELCGAFTGGVLALGEILGREGPGEELHDLGRLVGSFREWFRDEYGALDCASLLASFEDEERGVACVSLSAEAAVRVSEMLDALSASTGIAVRELSDRPRGVVPVGTCPFSGSVVVPS